MGHFEKSVVAFLQSFADEVGDEMPHDMERHLLHRSKKIVCMLFCEPEQEKQEKFCTRSHFLSYLEGDGAAHKISKGTHMTHAARKKALKVSRKFSVS